MTEARNRGLISINSPYGVGETTDQLERVLSVRGMTLFTKVDHAAAAAGAGMDLRQTVLLLFGNPQAGTPWMQRSQSAAIDFPQKVLVWQDDAGNVWISFNDPEYLADRHGIERVDELVGKTREALEQLAGAAIA